MPQTFSKLRANEIALEEKGEKLSSVNLGTGALNDYIFKFHPNLHISFGNICLCIQNIQNQFLIWKNFILVVQARIAEKIAASKNKISYQNKDFMK